MWWLGVEQEKAIIYSDELVDRSYDRALELMSIWLVSKL